MDSESRQTASLTREELYERVWSTPMHTLAPCFGLSDVGLKKLCYRYKVPTLLVTVRARTIFSVSRAPGRNRRVSVKWLATGCPGQSKDRF